MKAYIVQPYYSLNGVKDIDKCYNDMLALMDSIPNDADVIVLPESCHCQACMGSNELSFKTKERLNDHFDGKVRELAMRTGALVFANYGYKGDDGLYRNVTFGVNAKGERVAEYFKAHPAPSEVNDQFMNSDYSYKHAKPYTVEIDGIRYGFMTCYDFYMYENFAPLARCGVDIIIGCSHQRSDTHQALEIIGKFLSYNTNAYLLRSSISLGEESPICGCSMAVSPNGTMLGNMKSKIGVLAVEFNPKEKYYKKKGFYGTELVSHYEYIDDGRRPWLYRNGGSMMVAQDRFMPYPRICAYGGLNTVAPANSLPAFASAISLGAEEIAFNLFVTKDGNFVVLDEESIDKVSNGKGLVSDYTLKELESFDFSNGNPKFKGLKVVTFEEVLQKFACHTIMNIHIKDCGDLKQECAKKVAQLLYSYDCEQHAYISSSDITLHEILSKVAPNIRRCMCDLGELPLTVIDNALKYGCNKVELRKTNATNEVVEKAHENSIRCNLFCNEEAVKFLEIGVDTIITDDYLGVLNAVKKEK